MICRRAWQGTDTLMITDIPAGGHMQQKEKKFNGATSRFHKFPPPVTPSDSWRCQGQGSYHFIPLLSVSLHLSFHPSPLPHLPTLHLCSHLWNLFMCVSGSCSRWIHFSECFIKVHPVARPARRPPAWPRRPLPLDCSHVRAHMCVQLLACGRRLTAPKWETGKKKKKQRNTLDNHLAFAFTATSSVVIYACHSFVRERFELRQPCSLTDSLSVGQQPSVRGRPIIISPVINGGGMARLWRSETRTLQWKNWKTATPKNRVACFFFIFFCWGQAAIKKEIHGTWL